MTALEQKFYERVPRTLDGIEDRLRDAAKQEIDWEQRRYEAARDFMAARLTWLADCDRHTAGIALRQAMDCADLLIEELKKPREDAR